MTWRSFGLHQPSASLPGSVPPNQRRQPTAHFMPFLATVPIAVAAVVIAKLWRRRRDAPVAELEERNQEMGEELERLPDASEDVPNR